MSTITTLRNGLLLVDDYCVKDSCEGYGGPEYWKLRVVSGLHVIDEVRVSNAKSAGEQQVILKMKWQDATQDQLKGLSGKKKLKSCSRCRGPAIGYTLPFYDRGRFQRWCQLCAQKAEHESREAALKKQQEAARAERFVQTWKEETSRAFDEGCGVP